MKIERVVSLPALDALRDDWLRLHALDRQASVFTSWWWLRGWADVAAYPWAALVARGDGGEALAIFPISPRALDSSPLRLDQAREIHSMGDPAADYRGLVCDPAHESAAVRAFAEHLAADQSWDRLVLRDMLDDRLLSFLEALRAADADLHIDHTQGSACPLLELPASWDEYLQALTPSSRKSVKKCVRSAQERGCRMTTLRDSPAAMQLEALMQVGGQGGKNTSDHLQRARRLFESCIAGSCAEIGVLWLDNQPIAAQGSFIDAHAGSMAHYLAAYDDRWAEISPGRALDALCIRDAIERGFKAVDFLRGAEPYKHQFGARPRFTRHAIIARRRLVSRVRVQTATLRDRIGM